MKIEARLDVWINENTQGYYNAQAVKKILKDCKTEIQKLTKALERIASYPQSDRETMIRVMQAIAHNAVPKLEGVTYE